MKRSVLAFVCLVLGCVGGAYLPAVSAHSFAPNPKATKWEGYCFAFDEFSKGAAADLVTKQIQEAGLQDFEPFGVTGSQSAAAGLVCFKRAMSLWVPCTANHGRRDGHVPRTPTCPPTPSPRGISPAQLGKSPIFRTNDAPR
jgi:hypothetical protein